jgi:pyruvate/2-oxoglutarate dehydrogenase complex dihydrolipoamide acyltransferase (E2) component
VRVADLAADVADATAQAVAGRVDVRFLAPPDATVTWLDDVDRVLLPARPGVLVAIGLGAAAPRVVATSGGGVGVRTTTTISATADGRLADPAVVARLLAEVAAALESPPR